MITRITISSSLVLAVALACASSAHAQEDDVEIPAKPATTTAPAPPQPATTPAPVAPAAPAAAPAVAAAEPPPGAAAKAPPSQDASPPRTPPGTPPEQASPVIGTREPSLTRGLSAPLGIYVSGYIQAQYENSQLSEDQLQQGGLPLNQDRFLVRRARLRVDRAWQWAHAALEIDGNTTRGPAFGLRRAEVSLLYRNANAEAPPWVRLTAGLTEIPFGYEMTDSSRSRVFMERSTGSLALFPGEPDVGVRLSGGASFFRWSIAALNGEPIDDRPGRPGRDPNAAKDIVGRVGIDTQVHDKLRIAGGASFLGGKGFHAGTEATKNSVIWRDLNENGVLDAGELAALPGTAAVPSQSFERWVIGADLGFTLEGLLFLAATLVLGLGAAFAGLWLGGRR